jgi:hypothetical protein
MLLLLVVAFLSTPAFFVNARRRNYHPGRAASLPFLALGLLLIADHFGSQALAKLLDLTVTSTTICTIILYSYNIFLVCLYLAFISRNWIALLGNEETDNATSESPDGEGA